MPYMGAYNLLYSGRQLYSEILMAKYFELNPYDRCVADKRVQFAKNYQIKLWNSSETIKNNHGI